MSTISLIVLLFAIVVFFVLSWILKGFVLWLVVGMLPSIVAYLVDYEKEKNTAKTVAYMNFWGIILVYGKTFFIDHISFNSVWKVLGNPVNWVIMYSAAGLGWGLVFAIPWLVRSYLVTIHERSLVKNVRRRLYLLSLWGGEIRKGPSILPEREKEILATIHYIVHGTILKGQAKCCNTLSDDVIQSDQDKE